nr:MAG TPA: hypothetical protein [Caudoviricetes sp.]
MNYQEEWIFYSSFLLFNLIHLKNSHTFIDSGMN